MASLRDIRLSAGALSSSDILLSAAVRFPVNILLTPALTNNKDIQLTAAFDYLPQLTSYNNFGGKGRRTGEIDITSNLTLFGGTYKELIDGSFNPVAGSGSISWNGGQSGGIITFDWGPGAKICIDEFKWYQDSTFSQGTWVIEGGDTTLTSWSPLGPSFTLGGVLTGTFPFPNADGYRAYRLRSISGTNSGSAFIEEVEFKLLDLTPQASRPSIGNTYGRGDRQSIITVTTANGLGGGSTINNLVDGAVAANNSDGCWFNPATSAGQIVFDFGAGNSVVCNGFVWRQDVTTGGNQGTWIFEGSNDNSIYTQIGSSFTLGGFADDPHILFANTTGYRYYRLTQTGGTTNNIPFYEEIEFRANLVPPPTGTISVVGSAAGVATATAVGVAIWAVPGTAAGVGAATAVGVAVIPGVGSSAGVGTATAVGVAVIPGVGSSAGVATATAVGVAVIPGAGSSAGVGTATAVGVAVIPGAGASSGVATAAAVGRAVIPGVGNAAGVAAAAAVGVIIIPAVGNAAGTSTATAVGTDGSSHAGSAAGTSTAAAVGVIIIPAVGNAAGTSTVNATGVDGNARTIPNSSTTVLLPNLAVTATLSNAGFIVLVPAFIVNASLPLTSQSVNLPQLAQTLLLPDRVVIIKLFT